MLRDVRCSRSQQIEDARAMNPRSVYAGVAHRLRVDYRLAILTLFGVVVMATVTPFGIYRLLAGQWLHGILDALIVLSFGLVTAYAWRSGRVDRAGMFVALTNSVGCALVSVLAGTAGLQWMYPMVLGNFLLVRRDLAALLSGGALLFGVVGTRALTTTLEVATFVVPTLVVCMLTYIFASRSELQAHQLATAANVDPLTGTRNRRGLARELDVAMENAARGGHPLALAIVDVDHFKAVNDRFGHPAGDAVLVELARLLRDSVRSGDLVFRLGGEEFALLLPGADGPRAAAICEKFRLRVAGIAVAPGVVVTASMGAAQWRPGEPAGTWMGRADAAMYRAKSGGRDRVVLD